MANYYITPAGAGLQDGSDWANAWSGSDWQTWFNADNASAGDIMYVYKGTYTLTGSLTTAADGGATNPAMVVGISNQTTMENSIASDKPELKIDGFTVDNYWLVRGINFNLTDGSGTITSVKGDTQSIIEHCDVHSDNPNKPAIENWQITRFNKVYLEATGSNGCNGIQILYSDKQIYGNCVYGSDATGSEYGISASGDGSLVFGNVVYNCYTGISVSASRVDIFNNTIHGCTYGFSFGSATETARRVYNNIIDSCTTGLYGFSSVTETAGNIVDYNNLNGNTTNYTNVYAGANNTSKVPGFANASSGDFTPDSDFWGDSFSYIGNTLLSPRYQGAIPPALPEAGGGVVIIPSISLK